MDFLAFSLINLKIFYLVKVQISNFYKFYENYLTLIKIFLKFIKNVEEFMDFLRFCLKLKVKGLNFYKF